MTARDGRRRARRGVAAVALVLGAGSQLGWSCEAGCDQPYRPVGWRNEVQGQEPVGDWPVTGEPRPLVLPQLDTDGDGVTDTSSVSEDGRALLVSRSSGELVLTVPEGSYIDAFAGVYHKGDLDGDGLTDMVLRVVGATGSVHRVVPGATPDGTHALDGFAAPFADPPAGDLFLQVAGDVDGDGRDDVTASWVNNGPTRTLVWLGADVAIAPGSPAVAASYDLPGATAAIVSLEGRNALVLQEDTDMSDSSVRVALWLPEVTWRFTTEGSEPLQALPGAQADVYQDGDRSWFVISASTRGLVQRWAYDLGDLCAGAPDTLAAPLDAVVP